MAMCWIHSIGPGTKPYPWEVSNIRALFWLWQIETNLLKFQIDL